MLVVSKLIGFEVRIPLADGTVVKAPAEIDDKALVLMADIFPTGYFAAHNGFKEMTKERITDATVVVIGCGYDLVQISDGGVLYSYLPGPSGCVHL